MKLRTVAPYVVVTAVLLVASVGSSSPAAHPDPDLLALDLLASAQPSAAESVVSDAAFDVVKARDRGVKADAAATTSATCDGCIGESTALQVVYASRASVARLDNSAIAWAQSCAGCSGTALAVQVVVVPGRSEVRPNNRAMAVNADCTGCRTAAAAFQIVVVADRASRLSDESLAGLKVWFAEQAAALRASVAVPVPEPAPDPDGPTAGPPTEPTDDSSQPADPNDPTDPDAGKTDPNDPDAGKTDPNDPDAGAFVGRRAKRASTTALAELAGLVTGGLDADVIASDVDLRR